MRAGCLLTILFLLTQTLFGQAPVDQYAVKSDGTVISNRPLSEREYEQLSKRYRKWTKRLKKKNQRLLSDAYSLEKKMYKTDSLQLTDQDQESYAVMQKQLLSADSITTGTITLKEYLPRLDSIQAGIQFLQQQKAMLSPALQQLGIDIKVFQQQWQSSLDLQSFIRDRRQHLKSYLEKLGQFSRLEAFNKELVYYQQHLNEFRQYLKSPDQLALRLIGMAKKDPQFVAFLSQNSNLSQFFSIPGMSIDPTAIAGLQTRVNLQNQLSTQLSGTGQDPSQYMQAQVQAASQELNQLKDKINAMGGGSSDMEIPDFKPNTQKTKTFWKRMEWGMNIQSQRPNGLFPVTSDIALMAGFKINDKSTIGLGLSYKMGWGKNFSNIRITHQGIGLRSFVDMKLKGNFWITGGYELNHQQEFSRLDVLKDMNAWQKSGLLGLTKKFKTGKKNGNVQVLWDVLSYSQMPRTTPIKFRIGYIF